MEGIDPCDLVVVGLYPTRSCLMRNAHPEVFAPRWPIACTAGCLARRKGQCGANTYTSNFTPWARGSWLLQLMVQVWRRM